MQAERHCGHNHSAICNFLTMILIVSRALLVTTYYRYISSCALPNVNTTMLLWFHRSYVITVKENAGAVKELQSSSFASTGVMRSGSPGGFEQHSCSGGSAGS